MVLTFVLIVSKVGKEKEVIKDLMKFNFVKEASLVFGDYDIVAKIEAPDMGALNEILINQIRKMQHISMTTTLISI